MGFGLPCKNEKIGELKSLTQGPRAGDGVQLELSFQGSFHRTTVTPNCGCLYHVI